MRLLRLCLLILALRLFLSDPIMIYVSFVVFSIGRMVSSPGGLTGKYVTIFCSKSQAESEFKTYFYRSFVISESCQSWRISMTPVEDET